MSLQFPTLEVDFNFTTKITVKPLAKSKSMTQAEMNSQVIRDEEVAPLAEALKTTVTENLQQARERRASSAVSTKEIRKNAIEIVKKRTAIREDNLGGNSEQTEGMKDRAEREKEWMASI